jgi:hypothetical protein
VKNVDDMNNVRHVASRYFRNKKREYLKDKIIELARNSKNKNIRDLYRRLNDIFVVSGVHHELTRWNLNISRQLVYSRPVCKNEADVFCRGTCSRGSRRL